MRQKEDMEQVFRAALGVFGKFGYAKTTMEDIAGRLNMTKGNLYLYVNGKKDLYHQSVAWALENWQNRVRQAVSDEAGAKQRFYAMCSKAVEYLSEDRDFREVLVHDPDIFPMFPDQDPFEAINNASRMMIKSILEQGIREKVFRSVDTDRVSEIFFMIYKMFIIRRYIVRKETSMEQDFSETVALMTQGLFMDRD